MATTESDGILAEVKTKLLSKPECSVIVLNYGKRNSHDILWLNYLVIEDKAYLFAVSNRYEEARASAVNDKRLIADSNYLRLCANVESFVVDERIDVKLKKLIKQPHEKNFKLPLAQRT